MSKASTFFASVVRYSLTAIWQKWLSRPFWSRAIQTVIVTTVILSTTLGPIPADAVDLPSGKFKGLANSNISKEIIPIPPVSQENDLPNIEEVTGEYLFIENVGQFDERARFFTQGLGGAIYLTPDAIWFTLREPRESNDRETDTYNPLSEEQTELSRKIVNLKISFPGANVNPELVGFDSVETRLSYYVGNDPAGWHVEVPVFAGVKYENLYPGFDLVISGQNGQWNWAFMPNGQNLSLNRENPVRLKVEGAEQLSVEGDYLEISTAFGISYLPFMEIESISNPPDPTIQGSEVISPFKMTEPFSLGGDEKEVPALSGESSPSAFLYATYLGGSDNDYIEGIGSDANGAIFVAGSTRSYDFPVTIGVIEETLNEAIVFVTKISPTGNGTSDLVYSTILAGTFGDDYEEWGSAINVDATSGEVYVVGYTESEDFPVTAGAYDTTLEGNQDAFVAHLAWNGSLQQATYLGGNNSDFLYGVIQDSTGLISLAGETSSSIFPSAGGTPSSSNADIFVARMNENLSSLVYALTFGGGDHDSPHDLALDQTGNMYVTGHTSSAFFPTTPGAFQEDNLPSFDGFMAKVTPIGSGESDLVYATYLGGDTTDIGWGIAVDSLGRAYITGQTNSEDFPITPGAYQPAYPGEFNNTAFLSVLNPVGSGPGDLVYSTFLGGDLPDGGEDIAVSAAGVAYIVGHTSSGTFPLTCSGTLSGFSDSFLTLLNPGGNGAEDLIYSALLGGSDGESEEALFINASGTIFIAGETSSTNFPTTPGAFAPFFNGLDDSYIVKMAAGACPPINTATLEVEILDANGVPVSALTTNEDGWYTPNPLTVRVTINCSLGAGNCSKPLSLNLNFGGGSGRFYLFDSSLVPAATNTCSDIPAFGTSTRNSYASYLLECSLFVVTEGNTVIHEWRLWLQPTQGGTFHAQAIYGATGADTLNFQTASIHPVLFLHGILGSMPPANSVITDWPQQIDGGSFSLGPHLDPFIGSYKPLIDNLLKMGYELNSTLFPITYDWRQSNVNSAAYLRQVLANNVGVNGIPVEGQPPYVNPDGKADVVVHSMGGLVLRTYVQGLASWGDPQVSGTLTYQNNVNKAVFIASPHHGFPFNYATWEGLSWKDYLDEEAARISGGSLLKTLMDEILWPALILKRYQPQYVVEPCSIGDIITTSMICPEPVLYTYAHNDPFDSSHPGIGSLQEMLPDDTLSPYLNPGTILVREPNYLLETLGLNDPTSIEALKAVGQDPTVFDGLYFLYANEQSTVIEFQTVGSSGYSFCTPSQCYVQPWLFGEITGDGVEDLVGDNLIPASSTRFNGLTGLPDPLNQRLQIGNSLKPGHVLISGDAQTQQVVGAILTGIQPPSDARTNPMLFSSPYKAPVFGVDYMDVVIAFLVNSPVDILVTDPLGRKVGFDPAIGQIVMDIPGAYYTGNAQNEEFILLPGDMAGDYELTLTSTGNGDYKVSTVRVDPGDPEIIDIVGGTAPAIGNFVTHMVSYTPATTLHFSDDMENGPGNWTTTGGWGLITDNAHSPVTSWASNEIQQPVGSESVLTLVPSFDLAASRQARLTFWTATTLSEAAEAMIEISLDGGATWQPYRQLPVGTLPWQPITLDLTSYTGPEHGLLSLRFRLVTGDTTDRWLLDDVTLETLIPALDIAVPFEDDFEGWRRWDGTGGFARTSLDYHSEQTAWYASADGATLTLAGEIDLTNETTPTELHFWHNLAVDGQGIVEASTDNGQTWTEIGQAGNTEGTWQPITISLAKLTGERVRLRFRLVDSTAHNSIGTQISWFFIGGIFALTIPLGILFISSPTRRPLIMGRSSLPLLVILLCAGCCGAYWYVDVYPHTIFGQNRLDSVNGTVERLFGAEFRAGGTTLSPDGRWLAANIASEKGGVDMMVDFKTNQYYLIGRSYFGTPLWLDDHHVTSSYYPFSIIRVPDLVGWDLERLEETPENLELLKEAKNLFFLDNVSPVFLVSSDPSLPYWMALNMDTLLDDIEIELPGFQLTVLSNSRSNIVDQGKRGYSPDGLYYMQKIGVPESRTSDTLNLYWQYPTMFDTVTEQEVAHAYKWRWTTDYRGWVFDSSGALLEVVPRGEYLDQSKNRHPIYKLLVPGATPGSPLTLAPLPPTSNLESAYEFQQDAGSSFASLQSISLQSQTTIDWYIDDVSVFHAPPPSTPTPTPTLTPTNTPTPTPTYTATPTPTANPDVLFTDSFESSNFSAWSSYTSSGDMTVTGNASLVGSYGMLNVVSNNGALYVQDNTPNNETSYRARFYFDPNTIQMNIGGHTVFQGYDEMTMQPPKPVVRVDMGKVQYGQYQVRVAIRKDNNDWITSSAYTFSDGPHAFEIRWKASDGGLNYGLLQFWLDGVLKYTANTVDNDTHRVDFVRLGVVSTPDISTSGSHCLDHFESRRTTYIGLTIGAHGCIGSGLSPDSQTSDAQQPLGFRYPDTLLFSDGFESGDFSAWSSHTNDPDLTVATTAAMSGTYGLSVLVDDYRPVIVREDTPDAETSYQSRFYLDPNSLWLNGGNHTIFRGAMAPNLSVLMLDLGHQPDMLEYQLSISTRLEDNEWLLSPSFPISDGPHAIEIGWGTASASEIADGWLRLWIDGELVYEHTQIANYGLVLDQAELGAVYAPLPGSFGTYCLDEFVSTTGQYIGTLEEVNGCGEGGMGTLESKSARLPGFSPVAYPARRLD